MAYCGMHPCISQIVLLILFAPYAEGLRLPKEVVITTSRQHLSMIVPTFEGHLGPWTKFMTSIASSLSAGKGENCGYDEFTVLSIVSNEAEKTKFSSALKQIGGSMHCTGGCQEIMNSFRIQTLSRVLLGYEDSKLRTSFLNRYGSKRSLTQSRIDDVGPPDFNGYANKHVLQSIKKMYGCLFAHSIYSTTGAMNSDGDLCFAVDSESYLLRNSTVCEMATSYMKHRVVLTSPFETANPWHQGFVGVSRKLLYDLDDAQFGNFYAMESYNWFWEPRLVWDFSNEVGLLPVAKDLDENISIEESFNHFLFARRHALGYTFVDVHAEIARITGSKKFTHMKKTFPENEPLETICGHLGPLKDSEVHQIGDMLSNHGVLLIRCDFVCPACHKKCALLQQHVNMCVSSHHM